MRKSLIYSLFFIFFITLDSFLKYYVFHNIPMMSWQYPFFPFGGIPVFDFFNISFSINHVENTGAAWGMFSSFSKLLLMIRIVIIFFLFVYFVAFLKDRSKELPYLLVIIGAFGNIIDYFVYGKVIDMLHFRFFNYSFPIFNLADSLISIGIFWLVINIGVKKIKRVQDAN